MPALIVAVYTVEHLQSHPDWLYTFGDNLAGWGIAGQARVCRYEPNTIGIPTKVSPYSYLKDNDLDRWRCVAGGRFSQIAQAMDAGRTVVWPKDGIGTGRAQLKTRAPLIWTDMLVRVATVGGPAGKNPETGEWEWQTG
jgi:hypothetical protein